MKLLPFQQEGVERTLEFSRLVRATGEKLKNAGLTTAATGSMAWSQLYHGNTYSELVADDDISIPSVSICIPTGGGKTITGLIATIRLVEDFDKVPSFIVWLVPSDAIYQQVVRDFSPGGLYFQAVLSTFGKSLKLMTSNSVWTDGDLSTKSSVTILLLSKDSLIRSETKKRALLVYRNPDKVSSLSVLKNSSNPCIYELIKEVKPIFLIDEAHKTYTQIGRDFFKRDHLASFIVELTATPKEYDEHNSPNIIHTASGVDLITHQLIKNPIDYNAAVGLDPEDLLRNVIGLQQHLQKKLEDIHSAIVPRVLISTEFTSRAHEAKLYSTASIKTMLQKLGVHEDEILVKSSEVNELGDRDLDNPGDPGKYILTKTALMEGWDCKSVYILVLLNRISAPITNFQIIGRGLRQPFRKYYPDDSLNTLYILTNTSKHDESVSSLIGFLSDNGLSELGVNSSSTQAGKNNLILNLEIDPWIHYLNFDYGVYSSVTFKRKVQESILERYEEICEELLAQKGAELVNTRVDMSTGLAGTIQHHSIQTDDLGLYFGTGMERFRVRLFSKLRGFFVSSRAAIHMTNKACNYLIEKKTPVPSEQLLIDGIVEKVVEIRHDFINGQFTDILDTESHIDSGKLSKFFGATFSVAAFTDEGYLPAFKNCILGNMPKSLFNSQELEFARYLDTLNGVSWLKTTPGFKINFPYPLGTFYPDFIVTPTTKGKKPKVTYYIETKGGHLLNTDDSLFKKSACEEITRISKNRLIMIFGGFNECKESLAIKFD